MLQKINSFGDLNSRQRANTKEDTFLSAFITKATLSIIQLIISANQCTEKIHALANHMMTDLSKSQVVSLAFVGK